GRIRCWDAAAGKEVARCRAEAEGPRRTEMGIGLADPDVERRSGLVCSGDGKWLAAGTGDGRVKVWQVADVLGKVFAVALRPAPPVAAASLPEPQGPRRPLTLQEVKRLEVVKKPYPSVPCLEISPDGRFLMTKHSLRAAVWELPEGKELLVLEKTDVSRGAFSPDSRQLFWVDRGKLERIELPAGKREVLREGFDPQEQPRLSTDGKQLLAPLGDGLEILDLTTRQSKHVSAGPGRRAFASLVFDPADGRVVAGGSEHLVFVDVAGKRLTELPLTVPGRRFTARLDLHNGR